MKRLILFLFILNSITAFGQMFDTTEYKKDMSFSYRSFETENLNFSPHQEDTSLQFGHNLYSKQISNAPILNTGRIGSPAISLELKDRYAEGFVLGRPLFSNYFLNPDSIQFYNSPTARTDLTYTQGTGDLLFLRAEHSQNIARNWNFGINYIRNKTNNLYFTNLPLFNQERMTNLFSTQFFSHYYTMNRKYEVFASFTDNKSTTKETFGVSNAIQFDTLTGRAKTFSGLANFNNASNLLKERKWSATQFFRMGKREIKLNDSMTIYDSTTASIAGQWFHEISYQRTINQFTDNVPNTTLFPIRLVSLETNDSIFHSNFSNRIGYVRGDSTKLMKYWILHEAIRVRQHFFHSSNYQHIRFGFFSKMNISKTSLEVKSHYSLTGYNQNDYNASLKFKQRAKKNLVTLLVGQTRRSPDYNDQFFGSNYYYWNQPLKASTNTKAKFDYSFDTDKLTLQIIGKSISNFVYYDESGYPQQLDKNLQYININTGWKLQFLNSYTWENRIAYQRSSSDKLRIPDLTTRTRVYKEGFLFKRNMWARFGFEVTYFSPFSGLTYNPVVRQFVISNTEVGGFPIVDVFLNTQVKSMELYVSSKHLTQGNFINDSYSAAFYPLIGRTFQFGINWRLFD